jgi:diguanylate cyclase (GGDEF)-like protein
LDEDLTLGHFPGEPAPHTLAAIEAKPFRVGLILSWCGSIKTLRSLKLQRSFTSSSPMKRLIFLFAAFLLWVGAAWAAPPATLTTLRAIHALTNAEAAKAPPVAFAATVTYRRAGETTLFVQDGNAAIYVFADPAFKMVPGDVVLVRGKAQSSFRPIAIADSVTVLHHGALPKAVPAAFDELARSQFDCMRVVVRARVVSADLVLSSKQMTAHLLVLADGGIIEVYVDSGSANDVNSLLDAEVEIAGVASARFDGKMESVGIKLAVPSFSDVKILKRAGSDPWDLPVTPMDNIFASYHVKNLSRRIRVHGTITYYQPGSALVLQTGTKSLRVITGVEDPLRVGNEADVTGFPDVHDGFLTLVGGEVKQSAVYSPIAPQPATWRQLTSSKNVFDLVSIEGEVVTEVREGSQDEYVLLSDGQMFSAIYHRPETGGAQPAPMNQIPLGSRVSVTGICVLENSNPFERVVPFDILMREPGDIKPVAAPSWVSIRNLVVLVAMLLVAVAGVSARSWVLERRARRQSAAVAALEVRRSQILEDINGLKPLAEILEEIVKMTSFKLKGAPCWCEVTDGARLGDQASPTEKLRVIGEEIQGRSGPPLGKLFAGLTAQSQPGESEREAILIGAGLATLAIETRRLYSDLRRRSEFDLLTDMHNRFSLETYLDARIEEARQNASIFGLVYIDLDKFKDINDTYGHHAGDKYLQEVSLRMKHQLRPGDVLARLGGDEFAALVPVARNRAEVEEIARRLEHCFDEPIYLEGEMLHGSASVGIALYPEDGATQDILLSAADAAMYVAKQTRRQASACPPFPPFRGPSAEAADDEQTKQPDYRIAVARSGGSVG